MLTHCQSVAIFFFFLAYFGRQCAVWPKKAKPPLNMVSKLIVTDQERDLKMLMNSAMKMLTLNVAAVKKSKKEMNCMLEIIR